MKDIFYKKIIEDNKIIFYSQHFRSFWEYEVSKKYKDITVLGFMSIFFFAALIELLISIRFSSNALIMLIFVTGWMCFILKDVIDSKNFFFELIISKEEISFYTPSQQWAYKVANIKKIMEEGRYSDEYYIPIFFIDINGKIKEKNLFPTKLLTDCYMFDIIKEMCQYTNIELKDQLGNLVKF